MPTNQKSSSKEKELKLIEKIEKAKKDLERLKHKRKIELGILACKHGLDEISHKQLDKAFAKLAEELKHEHK